MTYEAVIGLEVHAQLLTKTKIFCNCSTAFGAPPNTHTCPVCLGMPGVLPVLNRKVVDYSLRMALATHCTIASESRFARKNYFYPDLPKGYQISQYELPIAERGHIFIEVNGGEKRRVGITRIHMEEDAGKLIHDPYRPGRFPEHSLRRAQNLRRAPYWPTTPNREPQDQRGKNNSSSPCPSPCSLTAACATGVNHDLSSF